MNYKKLHDQIVEKARKENRVKGPEIYYESHHIVPRCMNGTDDESNLVLLTSREHFLAHWLLVKIHNNDFRLVCAFNSFCRDPSKDDKRPISRLYKYAREKFIRALKANTEWKKKMSLSLSKLIWMKHSESKDCIRILEEDIPYYEGVGYRRGRIIEHRRPQSAKTIELIRQRHLGRKFGIKERRIRAEELGIPFEEYNARFSSSKNTVWVNDGVKDRMVNTEEAEELLGKGWTRGRITGEFGKIKGKIWINKDSEKKVIDPKELAQYISAGWKKGSNIKKDKTVWVYKSDVSKMIFEHKLGDFLKDDWKRGRKDFPNIWMNKNGKNIRVSLNKVKAMKADKWKCGRDELGNES